MLAFKNPTTLLITMLFVNGCSDEPAATSDGTVPPNGTAACGNATLDTGEACDGAELAGETCLTRGFDGGTLACAADCTFDTGGCTGTGPVCGDSLITGPEQCEGADLNGSACLDLGFGGGTLACAADCMYDTTGCTGTAPVCGNATQEAGEDCDGADLGGTACIDLMGFGPGTLTCAPDCTFDTSQCATATCGDGAVNQPSEVCDTGDLAGTNCGDFGFAGGVLNCLADCSALNWYQCTGVLGGCGDNVAEGAEVCDGADLRGNDCVSLGYEAGTLACNPDCTLDLTGCTTTTTAPSCGDDVAQTLEACDGIDLRNLSCLDFGFAGGTLACAADCTFDDAACIPFGAPICGDGIVAGAELCDGADVGGETCANLGLGAGTLSCAANCFAYDYSGCDIQPVCGNDIVEATETCDGVNRNLRCTDFGLDNTLLVSCLSTCMGYDLAVCSNTSIQCGNNRLQGSEICDGSRLDGQSCQSFGFSGGSLGCLANCTFDFSGCTP